MSRFRLISATLLAAALVLGSIGFLRWREARADSELLLRLARGGRDLTFKAIIESEVARPQGLVRSRTCVFHLAEGALRMEQLQGQGACAMMSEARVWRYQPGEGKLLEQVAPPFEFEKLLVANYRLRERGAIKRGETQQNIYDLLDRRTGQVRKRLWVDEKTSITVRQESFDRKGERVSRMQVTELAFPKGAAPEAFRRPPAEERVVASRPVSLEEISKALGFRLYRPRYLPPGYALLGTFVFNCPCGCGAKSAHLLYGDGLDSFSLFESQPHHDACDISWACRHQSAPSQPVLTELGSARALGIIRDSVALLAVGDLEPETLARVVQTAK